MTDYPLPASRRISFGLRSLFALFAGLVVALMMSGAALAQQAAPAGLSPAETPADELVSYDLSTLDRQWWTSHADYVDEALKGSDEEKETAMRKVIFLATYYPEMADFSGSTTELYNIWRFNDDEQFRIMALAALFAQGDDHAMRLLAYHGEFASYAPWDPSPLVRRLTAAAVARYYGQPEIQVGPLEPVDALMMPED